MNYIFIVPILTSILFCLAKFFERKFYSSEENHDDFALKVVVRDVIIIFGITLLANVIYINTHSHLDSFLSMITDTKVLSVPLNAEIYTDTPVF